MNKRHTPKTMKHKDSYIGQGVGPIRQHGTILSLTEIRDEARNLMRSLSNESLEEFMTSIKIVGVHHPERVTKWEWCPLKQTKGYCPCCTHIFVVAAFKTDFCYDPIESLGD